MLAELRSSMCKIRTLFQQGSPVQRQSEGEQCSQRKWLLSQDYCATLSRKLQQRRPLKCWTERASSKLLQLTPRASSTTVPTPTPVQSTKPPNTTTLQVSSEPSSTSVFKDDVFSSLELSGSPTTPFGIKAFKETGSQPLAVHCSEGPLDQYVMESLSEMEEDKETRNLIAQVNAGLVFAPPKLCNVGTGGVYFMQSASRDTTAVFKPTDEEPKGTNNPKGYGQQQQQNEGGSEDSLRAGIRTGEGAVRECAAFLLDHQSLSGVPPTTMVCMTSTADCEFEKTGSLQKYVPFDFDAEECGTGLFSAEEVQKICLADLRFVNTDRNGQNILVTKTRNGQTTLTPIDHGYCFPDSFSDIYFEWMHWPQAKKPFNSTFLKYIEELDPEADLEKLRDHNINFRPECNQVFLFCNYLLKWAVRRRCTPRDIAFILSDKSSKTLDNCYYCAKELSHGTMSESTVYEALNCHAGALMMLVD